VAQATLLTKRKQNKRKRWGGVEVCLGVSV
jgi:hypothetical protein